MRKNPEDKYLIEAEDEPMPAPDLGSPDVGAPEAEPVEEKDTETLAQEHVKSNADKYKKIFEELFPATQMAVKAVEYRGMLTKDKIRLTVDFQTPLLNFDALQVLSNKEIGIVALEDGVFRVYNIYLPRVKDPALKMATLVGTIDAIATEIEPQDPRIAMALDKVADMLEGGVSTEGEQFMYKDIPAGKIEDVKKLLEKHHVNPKEIFVTENPAEARKHIKYNPPKGPALIQEKTPRGAPSALLTELERMGIE